MVIRGKKQRVLLLAAMGLGSLRIVATYGVFNHTIDEPAHIACGMEWLDRGTYRMEDQHPPLARVLAALGPYLSGIPARGVWDRTPRRPECTAKGQHIYYAGGHYDRTLALARLGVLPCFWIACLAVYGVGQAVFRRAHGAGGGLAVQLRAGGAGARRLGHYRHGSDGIPGRGLRRAAGVVREAGCAAKRLAGRRRRAGGSLEVLEPGVLSGGRGRGARRLPAGGASRIPAVRRAGETLLVPLALAAAVAIAIVWAGYRFHVGPVFFANLCYRRRSCTAESAASRRTT